MLKQANHNLLVCYSALGLLKYYLQPGCVKLKIEKKNSNTKKKRTINYGAIFELLKRDILLFVGQA